MLDTKVKRPVLRYHGGKWNLAPWIISHFPKHRIYVEPFGGAMSVLLRKQPSEQEIYNDLDMEIVNLFRVLQDQKAFEELRHKITYTPFSREEFKLSHLPVEDVVEQARRTLIRSWFGIGTGSFSNGNRTGFRAGIKKRGTNPQRDWAKWRKIIDQFYSRIQYVVIEAEPAAKVIERNDTPETLFYVDPPYVWETRGGSWKGKAYKYEMTDEEHIELAKVLKKVKGMVILSGYESELYESLYPEWFKVSKPAVSDGGQKGMVQRTEILWLNEACNKAQSQLRIFK